MPALHLNQAALALVAAEGDGLSLFNFESGNAIWTLIIFVLSLPFMIKFVFGPIVNNLLERDKAVEAAAAAAEDARKAAEEAANKAKEEQEAARAEARKTVQEAEARAQRQAEEAIAAAKAEADRQLAKAREDIDAAKRRALLEIRQEVVNLSIASAGKILRQDVNDDAHRRLVEDFLGSTSEN